MDRKMIERRQADAERALIVGPGLWRRAQQGHALRDPARHTLPWARRRRLHHHYVRRFQHRIRYRTGDAGAGPDEGFQIPFGVQLLVCAQRRDARYLQFAGEIAGGGNPLSRAQATVEDRPPEPVGQLAVDRSAAADIECNRRQEPRRDPLHLDTSFAPKWPYQIITKWLFR
jgi:hypothetical protein